MKFSGICLVTDHVAALAAFYEQALGVKSEGYETHRELGTTPAGLAIFSTEGMEAMAPDSMKSASRGGVTLMFEVEEVDREYERLQGLGVEFVKPPQTHPWGARSFWFRDPDGNHVDFYSVVKG